MPLKVEGELCDHNGILLSILIATTQLATDENPVKCAILDGTNDFWPTYHFSTLRNDAGVELVSNFNFRRSLVSSLYTSSMSAGQLR